MTSYSFFFLFTLCFNKLEAVRNGSSYKVLAPASHELEFISQHVEDTTLACLVSCGIISDDCNGVLATPIPTGQHHCMLVKVLDDEEEQTTPGGYTSMQENLEGYQMYYREPRIESIIIHHNKEEEVFVDGFEEPNYYIMDIAYEKPLSGAIEIVKSAVSCKQHLRYESHNAGIRYCDWSTPNGTYKFFPTSLNGKTCYCSGVEACCCNTAHNNLCKTDNDHSTYYVDEGYLTNKELLPLTRFRVGDTGSYDEYTYVTIGPLECLMIIR